MNRRRSVTVGLLALVATLVVAVVVVVRDDGKQDIATRGSAATSTLDSLIATSTSSSTVPSDTSAALTTTTRGATCKNSFAVACGAQHWSPTPDANAPLSAEVVSQTPADPALYDEVSITVRVTDADAKLTSSDIWFAQYQPDRGDFTIGTVFAHKSGCPTRDEPHGEWSTPTKQGGSAQATATFSPASAKSYAAYFVLEAASDSCSFLRYNGKVASQITSVNPTPWFNPYASYRAWTMCFDTSFHASLVERNAMCPNLS